jgi:hypothetical protein
MKHAIDGGARLDGLIACVLRDVRLFCSGMPTTITPAGITQQVQRLLHEREKHAAAIESIDRTVREIERLLSGGGSGTSTRRTTDAGNGSSRSPRGRVRRTLTAQSGRRTRRRYAMSGEESILAFIKKHGSPTTQQIKAHWQSERRGGTADNALTKMVKEKRLKRKPIEGARGSTYELA